jgi:hypothetical protein
MPSFAEILAFTAAGCFWDYNLEEVAGTATPAAVYGGKFAIMALTA